MRAVGRRSVGRRALLLAALLGLSACAHSLADVKPGIGLTATIRGKEYDDIWAAAIRVADEHFELLERDRSAGIIKAERTATAFGGGAWIGIYVTPPIDGAASYDVEVVSLNKVWRAGDAEAASRPVNPNRARGEQNWQQKVLRDLFDVLAGRPLR
jgi:hypothetical protein